MAGKNKFGFGPVDAEPAPRRDRRVGPMGAAVRDTAENLQEATEAKVEQRRRNADDAKAFRAAQEDGLVLVRLPVGNIATDDLPRDRIALDDVAASDEMEELKSSIRERGQKEPIEVYKDGQGAYQLKKGWRRLTALRQLFDQTGDSAFANVVARVEVGAGDRLLRYVDMVEENVVREDLTFAEMAQVAITAAEDPNLDETDPAALVNRLYGSLHKVKRSYIRQFVVLLSRLSPALKWPKSVSRNLGLDVVRAMTDDKDVATLRIALERVGDEEQQTEVLQAFVAHQKRGVVSGDVVKPAAKQKFEFFVGPTKVTARDGELRIVSGRDFAQMDRAVLKAAIKAFEDTLKGK